MTYTAPDGHVITSSPTETVTYSCTVTGFPEGTYNSVETYPAATAIGIQQMKITRTVDSTSTMTISIVESTDAELLAYIEAAQNGTLNF